MIFLSGWSPLIPILLGLSRFKILSHSLKIILYYLIFSIIINRSTYILYKEAINNMPLLHLFTIVEFVFISTYLKNQLKSNIDRRVFILIQVLFLIFCILNSLYIQPINTFNTYARSVESFIIILAIIGVSLRKIGDSTKKTETDNPSINWINSGLLVYFTASLLLFSLNNYLGTHHLNLYKLAWDMHAFICIVMYLTFAVGLWRYNLK